jgi:uncharacterized protein (UPF0548 family)
MRLARPSSAASISKILDLGCTASPTYPDVGATLSGGSLPTGYHHDQYEASLGSGRAVYERAVVGLRSWRAHDLPGISVHPSGATVEEGTTIVVTMGTVVAITAPCRIVAVLDESDRWGFAYGTLPGHPEQGEEAFVVRSAADGSVVFTITAFSRPSDPLVRLSGPIGRTIQRRATEGYLRALRTFVSASPGAT